MKLACRHVSELPHVETAKLTRCDSVLDLDPNRIPGLGGRACRCNVDGIFVFVQAVIQQAVLYARQSLFSVATHPARFVAQLAEVQSFGGMG
jgi:hypothetical protein